MARSKQSEQKTGAAGESGGYTVLARRYRSRGFEEIIGQEAIARTLQSAIESGRVAHAYLFCGTRGVGKTSTARIFAAALNVSSDLEEADAITEAILRGDDMDVIEIDGASNRGVQEARDLIAGAGLSPARCRYRIYIIDEVHMLTRDAFNTLLKTMEEPPPHVKFILCTTEPNKVPATIQSRCQRFDFRAIPTSVISRHLRNVVDREGITADDAVLRRVAAMGNGSMRDALSMLERLLAGGERAISAAQAEELLGLPDHDVVVRLLDAIAEERPGDALTVAQELFDRGATVELALEMILEQFRAVLLLLACGEQGLSEELGEAERAAAKRHAPSFDLAGVVHAMALCDAGARNARHSAAARALFDATIVRLCLARHVADVAALLAHSSSGAGQKKKGDAPRPVVNVPAAPSPAPAPARLSSAARVEQKPQTASAPRSVESPVRRGEEKAGEPVAPRKAPALTPVPEPKPENPLHAEDLWRRVLEEVESNPRDQARVSGFFVSGFDGRTLRLGTREPMGSSRFRESEAVAIAGIVSRVAGRTVTVEIESVAPAERPAEKGARVDLEALCREMPSVRSAMSVFQAVVMDVEDLPPGKEAQ